MKRAYLVIGPESSGTRLAAKILIKAGCHGDSGLGQKFDHEIPDKLTPIVWRRSAPHGGEWPRTIEMARKLTAKGYLSQIIFTTRDWYPMAKSQVRHEHVRSLSDAYKNIQESYKRIVDSIRICEMENHLHPTMPYMMFHYEAIVNYPRHIFKTLMPMIELPVADFGEDGLGDKNHFYDGNEKWYTDEGYENEDDSKCNVKGAAVVKTSPGVVLLGDN